MEEMVEENKAMMQKLEAELEASRKMTEDMKLRIGALDKLSRLGGAIEFEIYDSKSLVVFAREVDIPFLELTEAAGLAERSEGEKRSKKELKECLKLMEEMVEENKARMQKLEAELEASRKMTEELAKRLAGVRETTKAGFSAQKEALQKLEHSTGAQFVVVSEQIGSVNGAVAAVNVGLGEVAAVQKVGFRGIAAQNMAGHAALHAMGSIWGWTACRSWRRRRHRSSHLPCLLCRPPCRRRRLGRLRPPHRLPCLDSALPLRCPRPRLVARRRRGSRRRRCWRGRSARRIASRRTSRSRGPASPRSRRRGRRRSGRPASRRCRCRRVRRRSRRHLPRVARRGLLPRPARALLRWALRCLLGPLPPGPRLLLRRLLWRSRRPASTVPGAGRSPTPRARASPHREFRVRFVFVVFASAPSNLFLWFGPTYRHLERCAPLCARAMSGVYEGSRGQLLVGRRGCRVLPWVCGRVWIGVR